MKTKFICRLLTILLTLPAVVPAGEESFPSLNGWSMTPGEQVYVPGNLWDLIDGAAEIFLSYGFVDLHLAEYKDSTGTDVRAELYRHSSLANAFGIYSAERNPEYNFIDVGTQGYIEDEVLNFLSGPYYVKLTSHTRGPVGREAMVLVARKLEQHLGQQREWPAALALFPTAGRLANTESYIAENFLGYQCLHSAFVARYTMESPLQCFIIELENSAQSREMVAAYFNATHQPPPARIEDPFVMNDPHNGEVWLSVQGKYVCGIYNCRNGKIAKRSLEELRNSISRHGAR